MDNAIGVTGNMQAAENRAAWTIANWAAGDVAFDEAAALIGELADVAATLVREMGKVGLLTADITGVAVYENTDRGQVAAMRHAIRLSGNVQHAALRTTFTVANHAAALRTMDYAGVVVATIARTLGTLIEDLSEYGAIASALAGPNTNPGVAAAMAATVNREGGILPANLRRAWTVTNYGAADRTIDVTGDGAAEVSSALAYLITDLADAGYISATLTP
jgi:hypothetical protein